MKKSKQRNKSSEGQDQESKALGLFDHIKQIREVQSPNYYNSLSDHDKKSWSNFSILLALSMDKDLVETISFLFKYFDMPPENMYNVLIQVVPRGRKWTPWIKSKKTTVNEKLLGLISKKYEISTLESESYVKTLKCLDNWESFVESIAAEYGADEKDVNKLLKGESDE